MRIVLTQLEIQIYISELNYYSDLANLRGVALSTTCIYHLSAANSVFLRKNHYYVFSKATIGSVVAEFHCIQYGRFNV